MPFSKIDKIPALENWTRMNFNSEAKTTKAILSFAKSNIPWNYVIGRNVARYRIEDRIDWKTAYKILNSCGSPLGRVHNISFAEAFFKYEKNNPLDGIKAFDGLVEYFRIGRDIRVPIKPLTVVKKNGKFVPIIICPWSSIPFDRFQIRLFMSALEDAIFSLTDFSNSPGEVLLFPKNNVVNVDVKGDGDEDLVHRDTIVWKRGDFDLLKPAEISEQIEIYLRSRFEAQRLYREYEASKEKKQKDPSDDLDDSQGWLF